MKKILLIDDEKDFCFFVKKNLELNNEFEVITAYNGLSGIDAAKKEKPDLILLDILMPKMDGEEVKRNLAADKTTSMIPVVFLTAIIDKDDFDSELIKQVKGNCFLGKPISPSDLKRVIYRVLER